MLDVVPVQFLVKVIRRDRRIAPEAVPAVTTTAARQKSAKRRTNR